MRPRLKSDLVFGDLEGYFGVNSKMKMIITALSIIMIDR